MTDNVIEEKKELTFEEFKKAMMEYAKEYQGDNYAGDDYYNQDSWFDYYEDGDDPADTVYEDMGYWD